MVLEKRIRVMVEVDDMQFGFMPGRGTTYALFALYARKKDNIKKMQEEYRKKDKNLYMCFVDLNMVFDQKE